MKRCTKLPAPVWDLETVALMSLSPSTPRRSGTWVGGTYDGVQSVQLQPRDLGKSAGLCELLVRVDFTLRGETDSAATLQEGSESREFAPHTRPKDV